jgi:DNA/RNA-binding domain of Phe-tRNA-synthetase-like protein
VPRAEGPEAGAGSEPAVRQGWVSPRVAEEFPGLGIASIEVEGGARRSPEPVRARLREISDRFYGSHAVHMRERPIPWAYRVFFRQIGLDPDTTRTPIEALALQRLEDGAFKSNGLPDDALAIATAETGVALSAYDAGSLTGALCIRDTAAGESLAGRRSELPRGSLVVADERQPIALLFGEGAEGRAVERRTRRTTLAAVQVNGVPQIAVDEALWLASGVLEAAHRP